MRYRVRSVGVACAFLSVFVGISMLMGLAAAPGTAGVEDTVPKLEPKATAAEACEVIFGAGAFVDVPFEGKVAPGDKFSVDVTWGTGWKDGGTVEVVGCTAIDEKFVDELSTRVRRKNDGLFVHEFSVPDDVGNGAMICEPAIVIGRSAADTPKAKRLDPDCFKVVAPPKKAAAVSADEVGATPGQDATAPSKSEEAATAQSPGGDKAAPAPAAPTPAPTAPVVAGATESRTSSAASAAGTGPAELGRTGSGDRILTAVAGLLFLFGGVAVFFAAALPRRRHLAG